MGDLVTSLFKLLDNKGFLARNADFNYVERSGTAWWHLSSGGSRAYMMRCGVDVARKDGENMQKRIFGFEATPYARSAEVNG